MTTKSSHVPASFFSQSVSVLGGRGQIHGCILHSICTYIFYAFLFGSWRFAGQLCQFILLLLWYFGLEKLSLYTLVLNYEKLYYFYLCLIDTGSALIQDACLEPVI
jgi:hypothetical protein